MKNQQIPQLKDVQDSIARVEQRTGIRVMQHLKFGFVSIDAIKKYERSFGLIVGELNKNNSL